MSALTCASSIPDVSTHAGCSDCAALPTLCIRKCPLTDRLAMRLHFQQRTQDVTGHLTYMRSILCLLSLGHERTCLKHPVPHRVKEKPHSQIGSGSTLPTPLYKPVPSFVRTSQKKPAPKTAHRTAVLIKSTQSNPPPHHNHLV